MWPVNNSLTRCNRLEALVKVDYRGYLSPEIGHDKSDPDQLKKVSLALDKILAMA